MPGFGIGINALRTAAQLIDIAGDNIANANTPGYHAKRATIVSEVGTASGKIRIGLGATVEDIERLRSELVESSLLAHSQVRDRLAEELDQLAYIELLFAEPSDAGLDARLGQFFDSLDALAADPDDVVLCESVVQKAQSLCDVFRRLDEGLSSLQTSLASSADYVVGQINALTERIAELNGQIMVIETSGTSAPTLRDNRDRLIAELAGLVNVTTYEEGYGVVNVSCAGTLLVSDNHFTALRVTNDEEGIVISVVGAMGYSVPVREGRLAGILEIANRVVPELRQALDELADSLRRSVNLVHSTALGMGGRFHSLEADNALQTTTPLDQLGYDVESGTSERLIINVEDEATGQVTQYELTLDTTLGADAVLVALRDAVNAGVDHVTAGVSQGRIRLDAEDGYAFGFATPYDPNPAEAGDITGSAPTSPSIVDAYEGETDLVYDFTFVDGGEVGSDSITIQIEVHEPSGPVLRTLTRTIDATYLAGSTIELENGLKFTLSAGNVAAGDGFSVTARASMDTAGVLDALGLNTLFSGLGASSISLVESVQDDPSRLATAMRPMTGDNHRIACMAELRTAELLGSGTQTLNEFYDAVVSRVATTRNTVSVAYQGQNELVMDLESRRDSVSGVSVDEEMVHLIESRTLYQGALKYISAISEMMDELAALL